MISSQAQSLPFVFFIIFSFINRVTGVTVCPAQCQGSTPVVRFPFRLITQRVRCGYPGFDLLCTNMTKTAIQLPNSVQFVVDSIDYVTQTLIIKDRDSCLPRRFLDRSFNLAGTPFDKQAPVEFTFLNCSSSDQIPTASGLRTVDCLSRANFTVMAVPTYRYYKSVASTSTCSKIRTVSVPVLWPVWSNLAEGVTLKWKVPDCRSCEDRGGYCGLKNYDSRHMELGCTNLRGSSGLPRSARYGIIIGVGIPGLLCIIGLGCYICGRLRTCCRRQDSDTEFGFSITQQPAIVLTGLDKPTIESYPKTELGESGRLPKPNDNTCPICLCEYEPKEILRTIPQCSHYYHASCIDEWLKINASCPLCRNSRESSADVTPSSSTSSSSSSSSLTLMAVP